MLYRGMNRAALDAAYNNGAAVKTSAQIVTDWQRRSEAFRKRHATSLDLRYGDAPRNLIDYYEARPGGPLFVFVHGGYWQMRAKELFAFLAAGPMAHGINVALVGYTLAPEKRLDGIVNEMKAAIDFLGRKHPALCLSGWSAGGHLTAMCMDHPNVKAGIAISGIYDLEPMRLSYINEKLRLDEDEARRNSPMFLKSTEKPLILTYGKNELPELQRQSEDYAKVARGAKLEPLAGHDHFSMLEELAAPEGRLVTLLRGLVNA
jgi:arylformamidase